jgi:hypothetical protein
MSETAVLRLAISDECVWPMLGRVCMADARLISTGGYMIYDGLLAVGRVHRFRGDSSSSLDRSGGSWLRGDRAAALLRASDSDLRSISVS